MILIVASSIAAGALAVWYLGAPPSPGPTEAHRPISLWTDFLMRLLRLLHYPGPITPDEVFAQVDARAAGCPWRSKEEEAALRKPVEIICNLTKSPRMHPLGKFLLRQMMVGRLTERRQVWQAHRDHPELSARPIVKPIFILGFPRAGSTFLFNLLSKDPKARYLTLWEQMDSTYADPADEAYSDNLRKKALGIQSSMRRFFSNVHAELQHKHKLDVETPEECQILLQKGMMITQLSDQEEFRRWFTDHDAQDDYELHRANVQLIDHNRPREYTHWVFKAPAHTHHLASLLKAYPDARVVLTLRHPRQTALSLASLRTTMQQLVWDPIDVSGCNRNIPLRFLPLGFENTRKVLSESPDPDRFFRCQYDDLVGDPVEMVRQIYAHFGIDFSDDYRDQLAEYVRPNQTAHATKVKHKYTADQFNITDDDILDAYADYIEFAGYNKSKK